MELQEKSKVFKLIIIERCLQSLLRQPLKMIVSGRENQTNQPEFCDQTSNLVIWSWSSSHGPLVRVIRLTNIQNLLTSHMVLYDLLW